MRLKYFVHKYDSYGEWYGDLGFYETLEEAIARHKYLKEYEPDNGNVFTIEVEYYEDQE